MLSKLKSPFPSSYDQKEYLIEAIAISFFVIIFLSVFKPFGNVDSEFKMSALQIYGFGLVTFIGLILIYFVVPKIIPAFFEEKKYTLGKDLLLSVFTILTIGILNSVYFKVFISDIQKMDLFIMIWQTFLVGIFPFVITSLIKHNRLLKENLKISAAIKIPKHTPVEQFSSESKPNSTPLFIVTNDKKDVSLSQESLLFVQTIGNYAKVIQEHQEGNIQTLFRTTLKALEAENAFPNILRCHRSYIVNLDKVKEITGNAQGLKLAIVSTDFIIPVSRKYIPNVKSYFVET